MHAVLLRTPRTTVQDGKRLMQPSIGQHSMQLINKEMSLMASMNNKTIRHKMRANIVLLSRLQCANELQT